MDSRIITAGHLHRGAEDRWSGERARLHRVTAGASVVRRPTAQAPARPRRARPRSVPVVCCGGACRAAGAPRAAGRRPPRDRGPARRRANNSNN